MIGGTEIQGMCVGYLLGRCVLEDRISLEVNPTLRQCWVAQCACAVSLFVNDGRLPDLCSTDTRSYRYELHKQEHIAVEVYHSGSGETESIDLFLFSAPA